MKTIIAATDFSPVAHNAACYAAALSNAVGAELTLLHSIQIPVSISEIPYIVYNYDALTADADKELTLLRNELMAAESHPVSIRTQASIGTPAREIDTLCERKKPFAVVMGTETMSGAYKMMLGSPVQDTIHEVDFPVLVVPSGATFHDIKKIAFASDLQAYDINGSFTHLKEWLNTFKAELHIINVSGKKELGVNQMPGAIDLQNELESFHPVFHFVDNTDVEQGVYSSLLRIKADLLIVQPHKRSFWSGLFHKSGSKPFITHPHLPLLALPKN